VNLVFLKKTGFPSNVNSLKKRVAKPKGRGDLKVGLKYSLTREGKLLEGGGTAWGWASRFGKKTKKGLAG